jgi:hypothetical protein
VGEVSVKELSGMTKIMSNCGELAFVDLEPVSSSPATLTSPSIYVAVPLLETPSVLLRLVNSLLYGVLVFSRSRFLLKY